MLLSLKVRNYALIADARMDFVRGLNIMTGETGAGKSILIHALGLSLGNRADTSILRNGSEKCIIEAVFDISALGLEPFFEQYDLDHDPQTILRREISPSGKSRMFINDTPCNLRTLSLLGDQLIEVHSQYDNLQLFQLPFQLALLDTMAGSEDLARDYRSAFTRWKERTAELEELKERDAEMARERDYHQFLFDELEQAALKEGEEEALEQERALLENAERLIEVFQQSSYHLEGAERSISTQLHEVLRLLQDGGQATAALADRLQSTRLELEDIAAELQLLGGRVEINPQKLEELNDRVSLLYELRQKHRKATVGELLELKEELEERLLDSASLVQRISALEKETAVQHKELLQIAKQIHTLRTAAIGEVETRIASYFSRLGMPHSRIRFDLEALHHLSIHGLDQLVLLLSSDNGKTFRPLRKSISGGELSRLNLIVKRMLSGKGAWPTAILDEIDTGVSGEIARKVGSLMLEISDSQQLIVITHLPQIASLGKHHLYVHKEELEGEVRTSVKVLNSQERLQEIAAMISGEDLTESALEQSRQLLGD